MNAVLLKEQALQILHSQKRPIKIINYNDIYHLLESLELYKIELELQNENLQNSVLEIEETRNKYIDLYDFIPFGYFILDYKGIILEVNKAGASLLEIPKHKLIHKPFCHYITPNYQHIFSEHRNKIKITNELQSCEVKLHQSNGSSIHIQIDSKASTNSLNNNILLFTREITNQKQKEEHLYQKQNKIAHVERNSSAEKIASVIAHEINHPLSVISNYIHGCIRRIKTNQFDPEDLLSSLNLAAEQAHRAAELLTRMKDFNCKGVLKLEDISINDLISEIIMLINYEIAEYPFTIYFQPNQKISSLVIDKIHIEQAILNIIRNAIEAMRDAKSSCPKIFIEVNKLDEISLEVSIRDNGPGLTDEALDKVFGPYYTTKSYGLGLGLAVSRSIIEAHGGKLTVEKNHPGGCCFKILLFTNTKKRV